MTTHRRPRRRLLLAGALAGTLFVGALWGFSDRTRGVRRSTASESASLANTESHRFDAAMSASNANRRIDECGKAPLPDCPLQMWMKGNAALAFASGDFYRLERTFLRIAALEPAGYTDWRAIAERGAVGARAGSLDDCRLACKACHDTLRPRYVAEQRSRTVESLDRLTAGE